MGLGFVVLWVGRGSGDLLDHSLRKGWDRNKGQLMKNCLGHDHRALLVELELDGLGPDGNRVVGACLDELDGVVRGAGVSELGDELEAAFGVLKDGNGAAQLRQIMVLDQLGGLLVDVESSALETDGLARTHLSGCAPRHRDSRNRPGSVLVGRGLDGDVGNGKANHARFLSSDGRSGDGSRTICVSVML